MIDRLQAVVAKAAKLTEAQQDKLAKAWEEELEELEWDALTRKPGAHAFHQQLIADLEKEIAVGTVEECE